MAVIATPRTTQIVRGRYPGPESYWRSTARFNVVPAGRRSLKTETAKRKLVRCAIEGTRYYPARFFAAVPTRDQAKKIYWDDLKALIPDYLRSSVSESDLIITLTNGSEIHVVGMDRPERVEGVPWDGGVLDEYGNMKSSAWPAHVRPALSDRKGWCDFIGVPEGHNHFYNLYVEAKSGKRDWAAFTWPSSQVLPPEEIEAARRDLDDLTFQQEYGASFVNFHGRAYYVFNVETHCVPLVYTPKSDLILCFDFNVDPGVAVVAQEQALPSGVSGTGIIGEVYIPQNSNTPAVCRKLLHDWGKHDGRIHVYGDATGGARGSAKVAGSDWDLVRAELRGSWGGRISYHIPSTNPAERARINAVNTRLRSGDGTVRMMVDPQKAPHVVKDLDGVRLLAGGSGEIDKQYDQRLSHLSDALGYYVQAEFPIESRQVGTTKIRGV